MEPSLQRNGQSWVAYSCRGLLHLPKHLHPAPFPSAWGAHKILSTLGWSSVCSSSPKLQGSE